MIEVDDLLPAILRFEILPYISQFGATQVQEGEWSLTCPNCGKDKLIVNALKKTWHCWVCQDYVDVWTPAGYRRRASAGAGGLIDLIQLLEGVDRMTAAQKILAAGYMTPGELLRLGDAGLASEASEWDREACEIDWPPASTSDFVGFPGGVGAYQVQQARAYLEKRGLTLVDVQEWGLRWCFAGRYVNRLVFPVYEVGRLVYWQARAMWDQRPGEKYVKSLNPPSTKGAAVSTDVLYNLDRASQYERVAVTEGPIDAHHVGPDAVASFGKQLSPVQISKLVKSGVRAIDLFWDADAFGDAVRQASRLTSLFDVRVVQLPSGDPGDFDKIQNSWYRQHAHRLPGLQVIA